MLLLLGAAPVGAAWARQAPPAHASMTLQEVLAGVRAGSPSLAAAAARVEAARARVSGGRAWMAPMAGVSAMNVPVGRLNPLEAQMGIRFMLSQTIPWPGKQAPGVAALEEAALGSEAARAAQQRTLEAQAVTAYSRLARLERSARLLEQQQRLAGELADLALRRYGVGAGSQQDVLRAGLETTRLSGRRALLAPALAEAAEELRRLLGAAAPDTLAAADALEALAAAASPPADVDADEALRRRPEFAQLAARRRGIEARLLGLERARRPDLTLSAEYAWVRADEAAPAADPMDAAATAPAMNAMSGRDTWSVGLSVTLPTAPWSRRGLTSEEEAWRAEARGLEQETEALRQAIRSELRTARAQIAAAEELLRLYRTETLPQARAAYDAALRAYEGGAGGLTALLEAWQAWYEIDQAIADAQAGLVQAHAAYRLSAGLPAAF